MEILAYLTGIFLIIYCLYKIVMLLIKKDWRFNQLFIFFLLALVADILSTVFVVHILGMGWSVEKNYMVNKYGNALGHLNVLLLNHFLLAITGYLIGYLSNKITPTLSLFFYGCVILLLFNVTLNNIIMGILVTIFK